MVQFVPATLSLSNWEYYKISLIVHDLQKKANWFYTKVWLILWSPKNKKKTKRTRRHRTDIWQSDFTRKTNTRSRLDIFFFFIQKLSKSKNDNRKTLPNIVFLCTKLYAQKYVRIHINVGPAYCTSIFFEY